MGLSHEHVGPKILAKIKIYILTRAELLFSLCYEIPCNWNESIISLLYPFDHCVSHKLKRKVGTWVGRVQKLWQRQSICINIRRIDTILDLLDLTLSKSGRCPKRLDSLLLSSTAVPPRILVRYIRLVTWPYQLKTSSLNLWIAD